MFHACTVRFDVTRNLTNFANFFEKLNKALVYMSCLRLSPMAFRQTNRLFVIEYDGKSYTRESKPSKLL